MKRFERKGNTYYFIISQIVSMRGERMRAIEIIALANSKRDCHTR